MSGTNLFTPLQQGTVSITSAVTTANVALGPGTFDQLRVYNADAANISFVNWGNSTVTASLPSGSTRGSLPIGPGQAFCFSIPPDTTHVAAICSAGTPVVYITPSGSGVLPVFPGDLIEWNGVYGLAPLTRRVWDASFGPESDASKAFTYQLYSAAGAGDTGSIYFKDGTLDLETMIGLMDLRENTNGDTNQFYGTNQIRLTSLIDQSGKGNDIFPGRHDGTPALTLCPVVGMVDGVPMIFFSEGFAALTCNLAEQYRMSTDHFTMAAAVRPFKTYIDGSGNGGAVLYSGAIAGDTSGIALKNNLDTYSSKWGCINNLVGSQLAMQSASNPVAVTITQSLASEACEIGVGAETFNYTSITGGSFTSTGFTFGGAPLIAGSPTDTSVYFTGVMFACMHAKITVDPETTATIRGALNSRFSIPAIDESVNIIANGGSTGNGGNCYGVPQMAGAAPGPSTSGMYSYPWSNFLFDQLGNKRCAIAARDGYLPPPALFAQYENRIAACVALYKEGKRNVHYISTQLSITYATAADYLAGLSSYLDAFRTAAGSQVWEFFVCGLSPYQTDTPTFTEVDALLVANAGTLGYTYVEHVDSAVWAENEALYAPEEWIISGHMTCTSADLTGTTEGTNLAAAIG
jgi:hypothetical protein